MPDYRVRYRPKSAGSNGAWTTFVDSGVQTSNDGSIDTGSQLGGSVAITGLDNGVTYEFVVDRLGADGAPARSSAIAEETPADPEVDADIGAPVTSGPGNGASAQLIVRNGQRGVRIVFSNASWRTAKLFFRPSAETSFPGDDASPNITVTRQPYSAVVALVPGSGDPTQQCFKIDNTTLFVPYDYLVYDLRVRAAYQAAVNPITVEAA